MGAIEGQWNECTLNYLEATIRENMLHFCCPCLGKSFARRSDASLDQMTFEKCRLL